ncbi:IclR family transcriptional regulator [Streptomyces sp. NPDC096057]|uniref:IclR family transcriptional regulator n=1 Tax=Streptomyces sp. NPDC096057 TaxID=3155543 RepID=UPI0033243664
MKNKPAYGIDSVDHALRLAVLLQQEGPVRVAEAAERLGVARSTAHRLLAMLVYRDFAEQMPDRRYAVGPVLRRPTVAEPVTRLRELCLPHLRRLAALTHESTHLEILLGDQVRVVASAEGDQAVRVGDREGRMLSAHRAAGGRALLAQLGEEEVTALYAAQGAPEVDVTRLLHGLRQVRRRGFALNHQSTEADLTAIGRTVEGSDGATVAAVVIAMPTARYRRGQVTDWVEPLTATVQNIERELRADARVWAGMEPEDAG